MQYKNGKIWKKAKRRTILHYYYNETSNLVCTSEDNTFFLCYLSDMLQYFGRELISLF